MGPLLSLQLVAVGVFTKQGHRMSSPYSEVTDKRNHQPPPQLGVDLCSALIFLRVPIYNIDNNC